jgi:hypothetical protein
LEFGMLFASPGHHRRFRGNDQHSGTPLLAL